MRACVRVCVCVYVRACVRASVHACVLVCACVFFFFYHQWLSELGHTAKATKLPAAASSPLSWQSDRQVPTHTAVSIAIAARSSVLHAVVVI